MGRRRLRIAGAEMGVAAASQQARERLRWLHPAVKGAFVRTPHDARLFAFVSENRARYPNVRARHDHLQEFTSISSTC